jgi:hypothetical protein
MVAFSNGRLLDLAAGPRERLPSLPDHVLRRLHAEVRLAAGRQQRPADLGAAAPEIQHAQAHR